MSTFEVFSPGRPARPAEPLTVSLTTAGRAPVLAQGERYLLSEDIATAANVAFFLGRPLLVTGEPGTGKTALAWALAHQLGCEEVFEFHAKSSSTAHDILYTVDNIRRFYDAQVQVDDARSARSYITWQALGRAIRADTTSVVLIDEIDKAPRDFPNDLLDELDKMRFSVPELQEHYQSSAKHMVLITSNSERRLPAPFLRRCVYHHIEFPSPDLLRRILTVHSKDLKLSEGFLQLAVDRFLALRAIPRVAKPPATDELVAWTRVLSAMGCTEAQLAGPLSKLPALQTLLKHQDDLAAVRNS